MVSAPFSGRCTGLGSPDSSGNLGCHCGHSAPLWAGQGWGRVLLETGTRQNCRPDGQCQPCPAQGHLKDQMVAPFARQQHCVHFGGDLGAACCPSQHPECFQACGPGWERLRLLSCWLAGPGGELGEGPSVWLDSGQEGPSRKIWGVGAELGFLWGTQGCGGSRMRSDTRASVHSF